MHYQCKECKLVYADEALAKKCEAWCREHKSCNLEITQYAIESANDFSSETSQDM